MCQALRRQKSEKRTIHKVSQSWHHCHFGLDNSLLSGHVLHTEQCLTASLVLLDASSTSTPGWQPTMSPVIVICPVGAAWPPAEDSWWGRSPPVHTTWEDFQAHSDNWGRPSGRGRENILEQGNLVQMVVFYASNGSLGCLGPDDELLNLWLRS